MGDRGKQSGPLLPTIMRSRGLELFGERDGFIFTTEEKVVILLTESTYTQKRLFNESGFYSRFLTRGVHCVVA
jgi:hypothetical protein